jgi:hypothetical protein
VVLVQFSPSSNKLHCLTAMAWLKKAENFKVLPGWLTFYQRLVTSLHVLPIPTFFLPSQMSRRQRRGPWMWRRQPSRDWSNTRTGAPHCNFTESRGYFLHIVAAMVTLTIVYRAGITALLRAPTLKMVHFSAVQSIPVVVGPVPNALAAMPACSRFPM